MGRNNYRGAPTTRRAPKDLGRRVKKKPCAMCRDGVTWVDYKDLPMLRKYMSDLGKIRSRRVTGNCAQHQRDIAQAIKVARELVLLPYTQRTVTERPGGRGGRGERGERGDRGDRGDRGERGERPVRSTRPPAAPAPEEAVVVVDTEGPGSEGDEPVEALVVAEAVESAADEGATPGAGDGAPS